MKWPNTPYTHGEMMTRQAYDNIYAGTLLFALK